jgi:hypothetical protein
MLSEFQLNLQTGDKIRWNDPDNDKGSGIGTINSLASDDIPDEDKQEYKLDGDDIAYISMDSGSSLEAPLHELSEPIQEIDIEWLIDALVELKHTHKINTAQFQGKLTVIDNDNKYFDLISTLPIEPEDDYVLRYVVTYVNEDKERVMLGPSQGRHTYETKTQAELDLIAVKKNNSRGQLKDWVGDPNQMAVKLCKCRPNGFDPIEHLF